MVKRIGIGVLILLGLLWLNNSSLLFGPDTGATAKLLAHRGVHQIYAGDARDNDTCRARAIAPLTHDLIENTIPSMRAAFEAGAAVVERVCAGSVSQWIGGGADGLWAVALGLAASISGADEQGGQ